VRWRGIKKNDRGRDESGSTQKNDALVANYECLRNDALSLEEGRSPAPGLALFLRKGMTAWMRAWSPYTPNAASEMALPPSANQSSPPDIRAQLTALLAGMILGQHLEITT
jgi:hypothetical protein